MKRFLGLSFSGGGYRAAAFSLGTLALLKDLELLDKTAVLSGVSGGSIALGAYLCAKAGAARTNPTCKHDDQEASFYDSFFTPFLSHLSTEKMAQEFVHLSWLVQNRKLIKAAAKSNDDLFTRLLGEQALMGSDRIQALLSNERFSPDYAFFNATDISSLNLFRFGLQKHQLDDGNDVAFVVGRWILTPRLYRNPTRDLYRFTKLLRIADCVAASHAFPVGLEPMVFPSDFFSPHRGGEKAKAAFASSEVCERQQALGLLDGGLYDNLGLASVEDIRTLLDSKKQPTERRESSADRYDDLFLVIATDVDNIQPSLSFYNAAQKRTNSTVRRSNPLRLLYWIAILTALIIIAIKQWIPWAFLVLVLLGLVLWAFLRNSVSTMLLSLGFTDGFVRQRGRSDTRALMGATLRLVLAEPGLLATLKSNLWLQRASQPVPMFSGYLKRTRALTYGYLQSKYDDEREKRGRSKKIHQATPHLVRNMVFELIQGAESDPDYASELITLPVQTFNALNDNLEEAYRETAVMRKVRHARVAARLIKQQQEGGGSVRGDTMESGDDPCLWKIWKAVKDENLPNPGDQDLDQLIDRLKLIKAAQLWDVLFEALRVGSGHTEAPCCEVISHTIHQLVTNVASMLEAALHAPEITEQQVLENCRISPERVPKEYSWIPLICEMATNLPTTLWIEGFHFYAPSRVLDGRVEAPGSWYSRKPGQDQLQGRILLNLTPGAQCTCCQSKIQDGNSAQQGVCPAAAVTTLAGYITTVFNLLEYYYSYLEHSQSLVTGLARALTRPTPMDSSSDSGPIEPGCQRALLDLPFAVRQAVCRQLTVHAEWLRASEHEAGNNTTEQPEDLRWIDQPLLSHLGQLDDVQARLDLLRPWLHSRGPFPDSWWGECGDGDRSS
ncbi:patatin-like phospholipase family protein [Cyanobium sp. NIES-981]|uniref:patatin-like phospholipase family protein n=1 Tax=Cyanobium sp. NIES-981 TaxID=1851505 RepID=UPI0007DD899C|nr:patatin-like phospholipase family protein [Cyanobium sp. NIES-981]SBO42652.1 membrane protein of unknown function [Cyanobium sp. NIES-981]